MSEGQLVLPIEPDGVVRLRVVPVTTLALVVDPSVAWRPANGKGTVKLKGTSSGLPHDTKCIVTVATNPRWPDGISREARLKVPGYTAGDTTPRDCSLTLEVPLVPARMFGAGSLSFRVAPDFPHAAECVVSGEVTFSHPLGITPGETGAKPIGAPIAFTPDAGTDVAAFGGCEVRVEITELDEEKKARDQVEERELHTHLAWGPGCAARLPAAQTWRVGCDGAGALAYAEPNEEGDGYEFRWRLVAMDGEVPVEVTPWRTGWQAARPKLEEFDLVSEVVDAGITGPPSLAQTRVFARGRISGISPDLHPAVGVRLWSHRPLTGAPPARGSGAALHAMNPEGATQVDTLDSPPAKDGVPGRFDVVVLNGPGLSPADLARLTPAGLFAVLEFPARVAHRLPLVDVLTYDEEAFLPFGDGDVPRVGKGQTPQGVATTACTRSLSARNVNLVLAPMFDPLSAVPTGENLVLRSRLIGADLDYWKAAAPAVSYQLDGGAWTAHATTVEAGPHAQASIPMATLAGKQARFRVAVTKPEARLDGGEVAPPHDSPELALTCKPEITKLEARFTADRKRVEVTARVRFFPTNKGLTLELRDAAGAVITGATVRFGRGTNDHSLGLVDGDGDLTAVVSGAKVPKLDGGSVKLHRAQGDTVAGPLAPRTVPVT